LPELIPIDSFPYAIHIVQEQGTLGTLGTRLKLHEFGVPATWNRRGTLGTGRQICRRQEIVSIRIRFSINFLNALIDGL
jgi:hypothetical protein